MKRREKAPHAAWAVAARVVGVAGQIGQIWAVGDAVGGIVEASTGANVNSFNNANGDQTNKYDGGGGSTTDASSYSYSEVTETSTVEGVTTTDTLVTEVLE